MEEQMFKNPFSFQGRICKIEYGISFSVYTLVAIMIDMIGGSGKGSQAIFIFYLPLLWLFPALAAKRCHDVNNSAGFQFIPFYVLWLLFAEGNKGNNRFGPAPASEHEASHPGYQQDQCMI